MTGWNMPPGCNVSDIPGNRPGDAEAEVFEEFVWERFAKAVKLLVTREKELWVEADVPFRSAEAAIEVLEQELGTDALDEALAQRGWSKS